MSGLFGKAARFARSKQGKEALAKVQKFAQSEEGKRRIEDIKEKVSGKKDDEPVAAKPAPGDSVDTSTEPKPDPHAPTPPDPTEAPR